MRGVHDPVQKAEYDRKYRARNREMVLANKKAYREANKDKCRLSQDRWRKENKEWVKDRGFKKHLISSYGITIDDYLEMHESHAGLCGICGQPEKNGRRLSVDHDHDTGAIRGLLCSLCNRGLGQFKDSVPLLCRAIAYLTKTKNGSR